MSYEHKLLDESEYLLEDEYNGKYFFVKKVLERLKQKNRFIYKDNLSDVDVDFGEVVGSILGQKTIGHTCDAELTKIKVPSYKKEAYRKGVSSFYHLSEEDKMIGVQNILKEYYKKNDLPIEEVETLKVNIPAFLGAIYDEVIITRKRPLEEYKKIEADFFDMIIYDCKFGNYDRNLQNISLIMYGKNGEIGLYPLYDNEVILGFDIVIKDFFSKKVNQEEFSDKQIVMNYNKNLRFKTIVPKEENYKGSDLHSVIETLIRINPQLLKESYLKIKKFSSEDFHKLLNDFPELSEERKKFVMQNFLAREFLLDREMYRVLQEELDELYARKIVKSISL